jgi:cytochrome c-type biogenesis protein CcmE
MTPKRKKRLTLIIGLVLGVSIAVGLGITAFQENMLFFFSPTQILAGEAPKNSRTIRLGGLVADNTVVRSTDSLKITFDVTDNQNTIKTEYTGILPDLFREGQGIVAMGKMQGDIFIANEILAKHDENYMPPEVADALNKAHNDATNPASEEGEGNKQL